MQKTSKYSVSLHKHFLMDIWNEIFFHRLSAYINTNQNLQTFNTIFVLNLIYLYNN